MILLRRLQWWATPACLTQCRPPTQEGKKPCASPLLLQLMPATFSSIATSAMDPGYRTAGTAKNHSGWMRRTARKAMTSSTTMIDVTSAEKFHLRPRKYCAVQGKEGGGGERGWGWDAKGPALSAVAPTHDEGEEDAEAEGVVHGRCSEELLEGHCDGLGRLVAWTVRSGAGVAEAEGWGAPALPACAGRRAHAPEKMTLEMSSEALETRGLMTKAM
jgi:hypothetical protein